MNYFNLVRCALTLALPLVLTFVSGRLAFITMMFLIIINNIIDDLVFYYASGIIKNPPEYDNSKTPILSPVNGIVTKSVPNESLFANIEKRDVLTKSLLMKGFRKSRLGIVDPYYHITVYINKFNKHIVTNAGQTIKFMREYSVNLDLVSMVSDSELIGRNKGDYLLNTFLYIEYTSGVIMILTLDKYVSKMKLDEDKSNQLLGMICRGSQCDLYIPMTKSPHINIKKGDVVNINQILGYRNLVEQGKFDIEGLKEETIVPLSYDLIRKCITVKDIVVGNFKKSLMTLSKPYIGTLVMICIMIGSLLPEWVEFGYLLLNIVLYLFMINRYTRHFFYGLMNIIGYRQWMTKFYKLVAMLTRV